MVITFFFIWLIFQPSRVSFLPFYERDNALSDGTLIEGEPKFMFLCCISPKTASPRDLIFRGLLCTHIPFGLEWQKKT